MTNVKENMLMRLIVIIATCLLLLHPHTLAKPVNTENFSRLPAFQGLKLSPNGDRLAFVQNTMIDNGTAILKVFDFKEKKQHLIVSSDNVKVKINWYKWANDNVLLVSARYETRSQAQRFYQTRLHKVDLASDDLGLQKVIRPRRRFNSSASHLSQFQDSVIDIIPNDPDHILMQVDYDLQASPSVYRVNINTARPIRVEKAKLHIRNWITDQQNVVRVGYSRDYNDTTIKYYHRFKEEDKFQVLFEFDMFKDTPIRVLGFGLAPNILYYSAYKNDFKVVYKMDLQTKATELVLENDGYDADGSLIYSAKTNEAIGINNSHSEFGRHYFNEEHYKLARGLKQAFDDKDVRVVSTNADETLYIARVESDDAPPNYFIGDRKGKEIAHVFSQYPELNNVPLAHHKKIRYTTRDDIEIEAYLTLPTFGNAPYPTVIHPHGGPGARDYAGFDPWVAYMTSRGYAVMRPNFRGSTGYGFEFAQAQMGRWGLEMQDDITDAAQYLIAEDIANENKICIFGASYGGYAAKMATVKTPDLFTCAVSFAGVADLKRLARDTRRYLGGKLVSENQIGDNSKDLKARSPISQVEKIKTPLLIMHGDQDLSVRVEQSREFVDELEDENKVFKYVEFEDGDHYLSIQANRRLFFEELDTFLTRYLGEVPNNEVIH